MNRFSLFFLFASAAFLVACGGGQAEPLTADDVLDLIAESGVTVENREDGVRSENSLLPNSYDEWRTFSIPEVEPRGGQVFVCRSKQNCDAIYAHYLSAPALVGPYVFQSPDGTVIGQFNSGLSPDTGELIESVFNDLP